MQQKTMSYWWGGRKKLEPQQCDGYISCEFGTVSLNLTPHPSDTEDPKNADFSSKIMCLSNPNGQTGSTIKREKNSSDGYECFNRMAYRAKIDNNKCRCLSAESSSVVCMCRDDEIAREPAKCSIKISGQRYGAEFIVDVDPKLDDVIHQLVEAMQSKENEELGRKKPKPNCSRLRSGLGLFSITRKPWLFSNTENFGFKCFPKNISAKKRKHRNPPKKTHNKKTSTNRNEPPARTETDNSETEPDISQREPDNSQREPEPTRKPRENCICRDCPKKEDERGNRESIRTVQTLMCKNGEYPNLERNRSSRSHYDDSFLNMMNPDFDSRCTHDKCSDIELNPNKKKSYVMVPSRFKKRHPRIQTAFTERDIEPQMLTIGSSKPDSAIHCSRLAEPFQYLSGSNENHQNKPHKDRKKTRKRHSKRTQPDEKGLYASTSSADKMMKSKNSSHSVVVLDAGTLRPVETANASTETLEPIEYIVKDVYESLKMWNISIEKNPETKNNDGVNKIKFGQIYRVPGSCEPSDEEPARSRISIKRS